MENFIIENFMTAQLGLNGNQLVLYAVLYKDTKGGKSPVKDDYTRYSSAMNVTAPTYYSTLKKLVERGIVFRKEQADGVSLNVVKR